MPKRIVLRLNTRGPQYGKCNICGKDGKLTDDHTPPKSCRGITDAELRGLHEKLAAKGERWTKPRRFQAGVCYRTLCAGCNGLLGRDYDPALAEMSRQVRAIAKSSLRLPSEICLEISPGAVTRSVLGHIAAQGVNRYLKGPLTETFRDYILDGGLPLPQPLRLYYWLYPHRPQVLIRDAAFTDIRTRAAFCFWLMKFFPLAFFVTWDEPMPTAFQLRNFNDLRNLPATATAQAYLSTRPLLPSQWPEAPDERSMILYGQEAVVALPVAGVRRLARI